MSHIYSGFYRLTMKQRLNALRESGALNEQDYASLMRGAETLRGEVADHLIENVIGVAGLPFAVALNFQVNGIERLIPMVVEEPSIVAGLSATAKLARESGGFAVQSDAPLMIGQVQLLEVADSQVAINAIDSAREQIIDWANAVHPNLIKRGGGVRDVECISYTRADGSAMLVVHLLVDTCDAMGANLINTMCEAIAPKLAELSGGRAHLRILSNLADRALVTASMRLPLSVLATEPEQAIAIREGIIAANEFAELDVHRATTHNKGIMNGVDAVVVATGNDWRAVEAGAHAYAARSGRYRSLTRWFSNEAGDLCGELTLPMKLGIVGGSVKLNPVAAMSLRICGVTRSRELDEIVVAVGLAQNFAALKALATDGIQRGHMALHARSVAAAAGATAAEVDSVVIAMIAEGQVKRWRAEELLAQSRADQVQPARADYLGEVSSAAKIILAGEHAVVFGYSAIGLPIKDAVRAKVYAAQSAFRVRVAAWDVDFDSAKAGWDSPCGLICRTIIDALALTDVRGHIDVQTDIEHGAGLGGSAALAVVLVRAIALLAGKQIDDIEVNEIAFACERHAHGNPSGVDNTLATFARALRFSPRAAVPWRELGIAKSMQIVVGFSGVRGATAELVAGVAQRRERSPATYDSIMQAIDQQVELCMQGLAEGDVLAVGMAMNVCQGYLNAIGVSHPRLEHMISIAREAGAAGAKLTGAGGGGCMIAVCDGNADAVLAALQAEQYEARVIELPAHEPTDRVVSFDAEELILVNSEDQPLGYLSKELCHNGEGVLHRAFSLFIFNDAGELLLQQRAADKRLWGGFWSNSCCSHPRRGESMQLAVERRLQQEMGMRSELEFVYRFEYQASFGDAGSEHELCSVYVGRALGEVQANQSEVDAYQYVSAAQIERMLAEQPEVLTPWFKLEWRRLNEEFAPLLARFTQAR